jgi:ADP-ribose pyrophosphatase YjhB (NUDIX family)
MSHAMIIAFEQSCLFEFKGSNPFPRTFYNYTMKEELSYGAIVIKDNRFLVGISQRGFPALPKGHIKKGETPEECMRREVKEEIGLTDITILSNTISSDRFFKQKTQAYKTVGFFLVTTNQREFPETKEIKSVEFLDKTAFLERTKNTEYFRAIEKALAHYESLRNLDSIAANSDSN